MPQPCRGGRGRLEERGEGGENGQDDGERGGQPQIAPNPADDGHLPGQRRLPQSAPLEAGHALFYLVCGERVLLLMLSRCA